jgi:RND family efflux transporter MFP subunit
MQGTGEGAQPARPVSAQAAADSTDSADPWTRLKRARDAATFAATWLEIQCGLTSGVRRALVALGPKDKGPFGPAAAWPPGAAPSRALTEALEQAVVQRKPLARAAKPAAEPATKTYDVVALPVTLNDGVFGGVALEVEHRSEIALGAVLSSLEWCCAWFEPFLRRQWTPTTEGLITVLEIVATSVHLPRFQESITAVATELAARLRCERVAIGFLRGRHSEVRGLSHSATFGRKANLIRALEAAMDEAIDQQATVRYPAPADGPLQVTRAHAALHEQHGKAEICTLPFTDGQALLGAITLEMPSGSPLDAKAVRLCEHAAALLGPILDVKRKDDRWLTAKAVDSAKAQLERLLGPRNAGAKLTAGIGAAMLVFFLFAAGDYRVTADARLEGTVERVVAAPMAGYLARAEVRAGDTVKAGQPMASLDDRDLKLERLKWASQRSQHQREQSEALAQRDRAQAGILAAQIEQADAQIALLDEELARVAVTAPFDGVVVAGDLSQSLGAPVERGDVLFEVAPLDSYRVILKVDERDIGQLAVGQAGALALTGLPDDAIGFDVGRITPISTAEGGRNYFRVEGTLSGQPPSVLRPGMEGVGKVEIGTRRLIWIWTHKIVYWARMFLWSWWP